MLDDLTESAGNETKSTAGDKHETALAMLQIEQENTSRQLQAVLDQLSFLEQIDPAKQHNNIGLGSLIKTNKGLFYIAIALRKITVDGLPVFVISPLSPLATKLSGTGRGTVITINNIEYRVDAVT